jgi:hypothetical protein
LYLISACAWSGVTGFAGFPRFCMYVWYSRVAWLTMISASLTLCLATSSCICASCSVNPSIW